MNMSFEEPSLPPISPRAQRVLVAGWISLGLHAALIALVQVAPPAPVGLGKPVIEVQLASRQPAPVAAARPAPVEASPPAAFPETPAPTPSLTPSEAVDTLPVTRPTVASPQPPAPAPVVPPASADTSAVTPSPAPATASEPAAAISSAVDLTYYSARDVDVHPHELSAIKPIYPAAAERRRVTGRVVMQLKLEADGRVSDLEVLSANPPGIFEASALQAFRIARFSPAQRNGRPVRALVQIEVVYALDEER